VFEPGPEGMVKFLRTDEGKEFEKENIENFREEINDLGVDSPTIISYGDNSYNVLSRNFKNEYKVSKISSYAEWISDEEHREKVSKVIKKLEISSDFPVISHSWAVLSSNIAIKHLDKSAFHHHGTGIPADIRPFFGLDDFIEGENRPTTLLFKDKSFASRFSVDDSKRLRLFWKADFDSVLKKELPGWFEKFSESEDVNGEPPVMRFDKLTSEKDTYSIDFISPDSIEQDVEAEKIEDLESKPEGGIKNYFGKKYERDPNNRKKAIELHGTICVVCGFDFEKIYGERGKGCIEVHHTEPLSSLSEEKIINPKVLCGELQ
jgi:5-methylcytosine-specific restriction protein A